MPDGVVLQDLPFDVELKKFIVDYYATGMPKLFASDIVIHDHDTGEPMPATVKVNEPAFYRGVAIYQSSFDDGGSQLKLRGVPMAAAARPSTSRARSAAAPSSPSGGGDKLTLEFTGLRVINVENFGGSAGHGSGTDVRKVDLAAALERAPRLGRQGRAARRSCATSARRSATSCATRRARRASTTTTCCRSSSTGSASSSPACATTPTERLPLPAHPRRRRTTAWTAGCACARRWPIRRCATRRRAATSALATPSRQAARWPSSCTPRRGRALALFAGAEPAQGRRRAGRRAAGASSTSSRPACPRPSAARISEVLLRILERQPVRAAQPDARAGRPGAA